MNKHQKIINKISRAETDEWNGKHGYDCTTFGFVRKDIRRIHKGRSHDRLLSYYRYWFKRG